MMPKLLQRAKAIRAKCMDCTCEQRAEIRRCPITECVLWPWRMGKAPSKLMLQAYETQDPNTIQASIESLSSKNDQGETS